MPDNDGPRDGPAGADEVNHSPVATPSPRSVAEKIRQLLSRHSIRTWSLWARPRPLIAYMLCWDAAALGLLAYGVATAEPARTLDWGRFAILAACATVHIQLTRQQDERRRNRVTAVHIDLSGMWVFPAALLLPLPLTLLLLCLVRLQRWFNSRRPPHKFIFTTFTHAVSAFLAHELFHAFVAGNLAQLNPAESPSLFGVLLLVGFCYAALQAIVIGTMLALGGTSAPTLRNVLGSRDDNLLEVSTIGLGTIAAILLVNIPPAIAILVLIAVLGNRLAEINQLQSEARTDPKTGIPNVRGWTESAERALARAERSGETLALLMIDLDHFKRINDTYGHPAGDDVLRSVAQT
ncbi:MAG TPA: diguanylate cyclase, partial [Amycolatopsis sp.]|nr:diguanylate cyclase [Amycolatopsis sp.]